ncbi:hypothetical protein [Actinomadura sp. HBU206391]|uniref:hypothetical protein n=1 Tax=Actinomadura sp. HBU206391 TaxID=2731692 RepID=UPI0016503C86|nr:hypothetical protein [Actinomadura sp. HBU206391]MBC6459908.1 hypothetical protein [Actinomadura sp. HBU206391]
MSVRTVFEPPPVLAGATGILGAVGVTDRGPVDPTPVGSFSEFTEIFGPASRFTMPELRAAFANGVARAVVARTAPGAGAKAGLTLKDDEGENVVRLSARAEGAWGNRVAVRVTQIRTLSGEGVKYVNLEVALDGEVAETIDNLVMDAASDHYLFDKINQRSRILVATDPLMEAELPSALVADLDGSGARAASALLTHGQAAVATATAGRRGRAGNRHAVRVTDGRASLTLTDGASKPTAIVRARTPGTGGTAIKVGVETVDAQTVHLTVNPSGGTVRTTANVKNVAELVASLASDPDIVAEVIEGGGLPAPLTATPLARTVTVTVSTEGSEPRRYADLADLDAIAKIKDSAVGFAKAAAATALPDAGDGTPLTGGRDEGPALRLKGDSDEDVVELYALAGVGASLGVTVTRSISTIDSATPVLNLKVRADGQDAEEYGDLTMDPDDERYLPAVLGDSALLRATDLFTPSRTTSMPAALPRRTKLTGGASPLASDYQDALDRLESAEEPDLVIASVGAQLDDAGVRTVHQQVVAHCTKMADLARNRIGIGSVTAAEYATGPKAMADHADEVRSDHFALVAPAGGEGAFAGLLAHLVFFDSPTFKTVPALGVPPGAWSDAQLEQLVSANIAAITKRRGLGIICVKGLLTSGRQINVQRTADKAVRDIKAIADVYIGLLNDEGTRNALKQQVSARLFQMAADGALVPSTDGTSPAFTADVHSTQADFGQGIVRIDVAIRPVRAIDYINATILVRN